ncbi:MAG: sigma-70 family RNA polymerase sigma factor [Alkalinema sp. RL_2_19]|nr:sigma-70 family RNA polymerase sigma factor [Alkalinema sp. RL_2_19]
MRARDQPVDLFATFAILDGDYFQRWMRDPRLDRNMQRCLAELPDVSEAIWANYWHEHWPQHPLAMSHLTAYLQEPCYWVAQQIGQRLRLTSYSIADYFQMNNSEIRRVLKAYSSDRGNSLKSYASVILSNALKDQLRQRKAADICSNWSLLRKISKKRLREALDRAGVMEPEASQYEFAWVCFKEIYQPINQRGECGDADATQWAAIAERYNTNRQSQLNRTAPALSAQAIETKLNQLCCWIREYLYPAIDSLNRTKVGQETGELQDDLTDSEMPSLLDAAIQQEEVVQRQSQRSQIHTVLVESVLRLPPELGEILQLFTVRDYPSKN